MMKIVSFVLRLAVGVILAAMSVAAIGWVSILWLAIIWSCLIIGAGTRGAAWEAVFAASPLLIIPGVFLGLGAAIMVSLVWAPLLVYIANSVD